jgi:ubiquinone/menaquinone biosynthesis C-methylase UbiE
MSEPVRKVLNVGGGNKGVPIPDCFDGWQHDLLDIDPRGNPDLVCDARELWRLPPRIYDAVYCSHNLEHFYRHDVPKVLKGIGLVLKKSGFVFIRVPDLLSVMQCVVEQGGDLEDILYQSSAGPILVSDVIYGYHVEIEASGQDYYAHKTGFTEKSLKKVLTSSGFRHIHMQAKNYEIMALAFLQEPSELHRKLFGFLPDNGGRD